MKRDRAARENAPSREPMRRREPRAPLPARAELATDDSTGMTHDQLVTALRAVDGLVDAGGDSPNFLFRSRPFLHFHDNEQGTYADVRFGTGDFEPVWASTPAERRELLARVWDHVESVQVRDKRKPR
jgi:hypothetical protein